MRRAASAATFALTLALLAAVAQGQGALRPLPPLLRTLSDEAGVLSESEGLKLSRSVEEIEKRTGIKVVMVIAETIAPEAVEDYAERLARRWQRERGIDPERSVFVVVAVRDREMQILPGRALGSLARDVTGSQAFTDLVPLLRDRRYFEALMTVTSRLLELLTDAAKRSPERRS